MPSPTALSVSVLAGAAASCVTFAQTFDVILIDFASDPTIAADQQIFDVDGLQDPFNFYYVDPGSLSHLTGSPGGNYWTLKLEEGEFGEDVYIAGSGTTGRTVLAEGTFRIDGSDFLPDFSLGSTGRMPINDSGKFAIGLDFFPDFITGQNPVSSVERRGGRVVTGNADDLGDTTVDLVLGEGQLLSDFFTAPAFDPNVAFGLINIFVVDSVFLGMPTSPTVCGPATNGVETAPTTYLPRFSVWGVDNNGGLLFETAVNGPGIINDGGEVDVDGNYYKDLTDCRLRNPTLPAHNSRLLFQGFGTPEVELISQSNITSFTGSSLGHASYETLPTTPGQDAKGTSFSAETRPTVGIGVFTIDQLVKDGVQLTVEGEQLLAPADPVTTDLDTISNIKTSFTTPLGVNYATVVRNLSFTYYIYNADFDLYEPDFVSDESDNVKDMQVPGYGLLLKDGVPILREGDPIIPGSTLTWDDPDQDYDTTNGQMVFEENQTGNIITVVDRDGVTQDTFIGSTGDGQIPIGAVVGNMRGDVIYMGDVDDQDPNSRGTFAAVLNEQRIVLQNGAPIQIDAEPPFGTPETYYIGKDIIRSHAGERVELFLSNDGYMYMIATIVDTPNLPLGFTDARNAIVGEAFVRFKVFDVLDIDRDATIEPLDDFLTLVGHVNAETLGKGDYDLSCVIDWFDVAACAEDFENYTP